MSDLLGNVLGVVVTYYPTGDVQCRLGRMREIADDFVIIDNSADRKVLSTLNEIGGRIGAPIVANQKNVGVAAALNQGVKLGQKRGADWVLFFDQDTRPADAFRLEMNRIVANYSDQKSIGIIGSNYIKSSDSTTEFPRSKKPSVSYVHASVVITSGSLHKVDMIERIGLFKEEYFIDCVDIEYCWRASRFGYSILRSSEPLMTHSIGESTRHTILGYKTGTSNHSAFRRYFMARNTVLLAKEYVAVYPFRSIRILFSRLKSTFIMCLFEGEKVSKFNFTLLGLWDGLVGRQDVETRWVSK